MTDLKPQAKKAVAASGMSRRAENHAPEVATARSVQRARYPSVMMVTLVAVASCAGSISARGRCMRDRAFFGSPQL